MLSWTWLNHGVTTKIFTLPKFILALFKLISCLIVVHVCFSGGFSDLMLKVNIFAY
jgi:hypothetical protein